jgi:hypothetical protein
VFVFSGIDIFPEFIGGFPELLFNGFFGLMIVFGFGHKILSIS